MVRFNIARNKPSVYNVLVIDKGGENMKFFHVYNDWHIKGLEKNNFINEDSGFKIQHIFSMPEELKFNRIAAKGGNLHSLIKENKYPFYVDRIAGGCTYHKYDLDRELVREYENILGDEFLGFQLHESASNIYDCDWQDILKSMDGRKGPYDLEELKEKMLSPYTLPNGTPLYRFGQGTVEEYARLKYPETPEEFYEQVEKRYKRFLDDTDGHILAVDSFYLLTKLHNELGVKTFMPEVGWQIGQARVAVASARGMAENNGKKWGTYYETWFAEHVTDKFASMPCFNDDPSNEWYLDQSQHPDDFSTHGPNGGSSRRLQKRLYYYTLMSGADYMAEEWGLNCSYTDMQTFELSEYGLAKKEFIEFMRDYKKVKARVPFAIVLPLEYSCVQVAYPFTPYKMGVHRDTYMQCKLSPERRAFNGHVEDVINLIFEMHGGPFGNESHILTNSRFGDLFDIIFEDAGEEVFAKYDGLIDASPDGRVTKMFGDKFRVFESGDLEKLERDIRICSEEVLPVTCDKLLWVLSEDEKGRYISIFNNEGNYRSRPDGDHIDRAADARVKVSFKNAANLETIKLSSPDIKIEKADDTTYYVDMPATEFAIFRF